MEVIPDALAVISLNTMYFYASNEGTYMALPAVMLAFQ